MPTNGPGIAVVGSAYLDIVVRQDPAGLATAPDGVLDGDIRFQPGGGLLNVAGVLHALGADVRSFGVVGADAPGGVLRSLSDEPLMTAVRGTTAVALIFENGHRRTVHKPGSVVIRADRLARVLEHSDVSALVIAYANGSPVPLDEVAELARAARSIPLAVIAGLHAFAADETVATRERAAVRAMMSHADILAMNEVEACQFTEKSNLAAAIDAIQRMLPDMTSVFVTQGASGVSHVTRRDCVAYRAPSVPCQRTLGAGDAFLAGLAFGFASSRRSMAGREQAVQNARIAALTAAGNWVSGVANLQSPFRLDDGISLDHL